jgi:membrane-associated protein
VFGIPWLDPSALIAWFGPFALLGVCAMVFAETGLLVGFFLPGDSLLFITGLLTAGGFHSDTPAIGLPMWLVAACVAISAFLGTTCGFLIGRQLGPSLFTRESSRLFNPRNVERAHAFFDRHGGSAIFLGQFVPLIRTFIPVVAGVSGMKLRHFFAYNVGAALAWGAGLVVTGHYLGRIALIREHVDVILVAVVVVSLIPMSIRWWQSRRRARVAPTAAGTAAGDAKSEDAAAAASTPAPPSREG